ncbi:hypothetical protein AC338_001517 [Salmonella enterica subsp. enterica]|uniref:Uncharacterized protein n=1 Tax=Salmonella enterica TaxID=28901 RepID=A0A749SSC5_SALER|nr:hypothetical protein [Salmonella enterica subsp. enterica]EAM8569869.1 hypothetical protein [Salmonella enterica]EAO0018780.1 hypothetical protein [Salmonella enterica subsp. enterica serovar Amsterdam var. 15+,34+]EBK5871643.1 hypothetical protein [Salmonella enterica subsp. enterica serovar Amsterdam]ECD5353721.1 hypothetical protein [Salmonella enterica subsp. enterica serovar Telaviv]EDW5000601.1 hypothetical protein [Salmonella enterica subsp. enterica serovar Isangi]EDW7362307.1 hypo
MCTNFLKASLLITSTFWCIALQCAEVRTDIKYNSQIISQFDSISALAGDPTFDTIHTPLPTNIHILSSCTKSGGSGGGGGCIPGTLPDGLESTLEFDPSTSFINTTAVDNGITYSFTGEAVKATAHASCTANQATNSAICVWDKSFSLPLTLLTKQNGITINQQNLTVSVIPGGGNSDTNQYSSLSGHIIIDESVSSYTNYEPETSGIENLKLKWTVTVTEDTEGDVGIWNGSLVLNGSPASTLHRYLLPEILDASFSENTIAHSTEVAMTGAKNNVELASVYLYHGNTPCDDTSLCNYSLNKTSVSLVCHDLNAQLNFSNTCNASGTTHCLNGKVGTIKGTWERVNIDTTCAITVLIPYE